MPDFSVPIKYYDGSINKVDSETKNAVKNALYKAISRIEPDFFKGLSFHIASDYSNLDNHNSLSTYLRKEQNSYSSTRGMADNSGNREVYIQESAFKFTKLLNLLTSFSFTAKTEIEQATMHELGHQFDYYYGTDEGLKKKYDELLAKYPDSYEKEVELTKEEKQFFSMYQNNNGYSDSQRFKDAVYNDLQQLDVHNLNLDEGYFVAEFYNKGLDLKPTKEDVQKGDYSRGELFAQAFSYAMGTEDRYKEDFIKRFPQSYNVVLNYIAQHTKSKAAKSQF